MIAILATGQALHVLIGSHHCTSVRARPRAAPTRVGGTVCRRTTARCQHERGADHPAGGRWGRPAAVRYTWARAIWFGHSRAHRVITFNTAKEDAAECRLQSGRPTPILPRSATADAAAKRDAD